MTNKRIQLRYPSDRCLFVLGCDRSGTTLLQRMLNAHSKIMVTYEWDILNRYERVFRDHGLEALADVVEKRGVLKARSILADQELQGRRDDHLFAMVIARLFREHAKSQGKQYWGDKYPGYTRKVGRLAELFPNAFFVHIVRDPRAVALSWEKTRWGPNTAPAAATEWARRVEHARVAMQDLSAERSIAVLYEDLVNHPEQTLRNICRKFGVDFQPQMLESSTKTGFNNPTLDRLHPLVNLAPQRSVLEKWKTQSPRVLTHIEARCYDEMQKWNYVPLNAKQPVVPIAWRAYYRLLGKLRSLHRRKVIPLLNR